jgi:hypothetical protein
VYDSLTSVHSLQRPVPELLRQALIEAVRMRYAITWVGLAAVLGLGIGSLNWPTYHRIAMRGISGQAVVVELLPKIHQTVRYEYHIAERTFQGQMRSWQPNPPIEQLKVGQPLVIYYDPERPEKSLLGDPRPILENETVSVALAAIGLPTFLVVVWAWKSSRKHAGCRGTAQPG